MAFDFTSTSKSSGISSFGTVNNTVGNSSTNLSDIATSLENINNLMDDAKKRLTDHLLQEESKAAKTSADVGQADFSKLESMIQSVQERLDKMVSMSFSNPSTAPVANPDSASKQDVTNATTQIQELFNGQNHSLGSAFSSLEKQISDGVNYIVGHLQAQAKSAPVAPAQVAPAQVAPAQVAPAQVAPAPAQPVVETPKPQPVPIIQSAPAKPSGDSISKSQLMKMILGPELCANSALGVYRDELLDGFLRGDRASAGLIGVMIEFLSSTPERMPRLLQDIGEAYYRWHPKRGQGADAFERALAHFVCEACESVGIKNSIELVETGQRFDAGRHNSASRGVEITEVKGWVVLRDNGKVYTRAAVEVQ